MSRKHATTSTPHINSLCKTNGHDWHETVSHTYRICRREGCRAAQRLVNGKWMNATLASTSRHKQGVTTASTPLLWTTQQYDALTFPYPGYDPAHERRVMQQYYKAIADESSYRARQRHQRAGGAPCK